MIGKITGKMNTQVVTNAAKRIYSAGAKGGDLLEKALIDFYKEGIKNPGAAEYILKEQKLNWTKSFWDKNCFTRFGKWLQANTVSSYNFNKTMSSPEVSRYVENMENVYNSLYPKTGYLRETVLKNMENNTKYDGSGSMIKIIKRTCKTVLNKFKAVTHTARASADSFSAGRSAA